MRALRSLLFAPGNKPHVVGKALESDADAVIVDLEDAVPPADKETAREQLASLPRTDRPLFVRVNGPETPLFWADVCAAVEARPAGIVVPKVETSTQIVELAGALNALESRRGAGARVEILPMIESARGVRGLDTLLGASDRVSSVCAGSAESGDLVADLGCEWSPEGIELLTARSLVVLAARAAGIEYPLDGVFMNLADDDALRRECELARRLGYTGKAVIHPRQIPVVHEVFTPASALLDEQERLIERYDQALAAGDGAVAVDGRMVDEAVARRARRLLALGGREPGVAR